MADFPIHIAQADHNESLAAHLLNEARHDWAITVCFYAAIHYFEARLFLSFCQQDKKHTDTSIPTDEDGIYECGPHQWRINLIAEFLSDEVYSAFRTLKESSEWARYLARSERGQSATFLLEPAFLRFECADAERAAEALECLKSGCKVELARFIYGLELEQHTNEINATFITNKLLKNYSTADELLQNGKQGLLDHLALGQVELLEERLKSKGHNLPPQRE